MDMLLKLFDWANNKFEEFMIFLEYPLDYIEEYGDSLKELDTGHKVLKVGKSLLSIYAFVLLIYLLIFVALWKFLLGGSGGGSVAEGIYEDALRSEAEAAQRAADAGMGSYAAVDAVNQERENLK